MRRMIAALSASALILLVALPVAAVTPSATYIGRYGGLGTVTLKVYTDGRGDMVVNLKGLKAGATYAVALVRGRCPGSVVLSLGTLTATSAGKIGRTVHMAKAPTERPVGARVGSVCRTLYAPAPAATPSPSASPSPTPTPAPTASAVTCPVGTPCLGTYTGITIGADGNANIAPTEVTVTSIGSGNFAATVTLDADAVVPSSVLSNGAMLLGPNRSATGATEWHDYAWHGTWGTVTFHVPAATAEGPMWFRLQNGGQDLWWFLVQR